MTEKYIPPTFTPPNSGYASNAYHCPHCGVHSKQRFYLIYRSGHNLNSEHISTLSLSYCDHCNKYVVWSSEEQKILYPLTSTAPMPHEDMPEDIQPDYEEARQIVTASPRGASALLRLCVQKLMPHLGAKGKDINADIGILVKRGLPIQIQQALDSLRVIGNKAVHPGQINLSDDVGTALSLFELLNVIIDNQISQPKRIANVYQKLPISSLDQIKNRDGN